MLLTFRHKKIRGQFRSSRSSSRCRLTSHPTRRVFALMRVSWLQHPNLKAVVGTTICSLTLKTLTRLSHRLLTRHLLGLSSQPSHEEVFLSLALVRATAENNEQVETIQRICRPNQPGSEIAELMHMKARKCIILMLGVHL